MNRRQFLTGAIGAAVGLAIGIRPQQSSGWHHCVSVSSDMCRREIYLDGHAIPEFAMWNTALTTEEIALLAKGLSPTLVRPENLIALRFVIDEARAL